MSTEGSLPDEQSNGHPEESQVPDEREQNRKKNKRQNRSISEETHEKVKKMLKNPLSETTRRIMATEIAYYLANQRKKEELKANLQTQIYHNGIYYPQENISPYQQSHRVSLKKTPNGYVVEQSSSPEHSFDLIKESLKTPKKIANNLKNSNKNELNLILKKRGRPKLGDHVVPIVARVKPDASGNKKVPEAAQDISAEDSNGTASVDPSIFTVDEANNYRCPNPGCEKHFPTLSRVKRHYVTHTGLKMFKCPNPKCNRHFGRSDNMLQHFRNHCKITKKELSQKSESDFNSNIDSPVASSTMIGESNITRREVPLIHDQVFLPGSSSGEEQACIESRSLENKENKKRSVDVDDDLQDEVKKKRRKFKKT